MSKLSKRHFWEWFKRNNNEYRTLNKRPKKEVRYWLNELNAHLRAYFKFFDYSLEISDKGISALTVTVKGKTTHFEKAEAFVAFAPEIPGWKFNALDAPMPIDYFLEKEIEDLSIHPSEFSFSFEEGDPGSGCIIVYHPLFTEDNKREFLHLAHAAVYNLLGERSFGMDLQYLEIDNLSTAGSRALYKLEELPALMRPEKSSMVISDSGKLIVNER
jgi:hypothetical protein